MARLELCPGLRCDSESTLCGVLEEGAAPSAGGLRQHRKCFVGAPRAKRPRFRVLARSRGSILRPRLQNMTGPTHNWRGGPHIIGEVARGAGTPRSGGAAERRLDGIAYVASREQFL